MFNYIPITFYVEIDVTKIKLFTKVMLPFFNSFYALEDNKKKVVRYYEKLEEHMNPGGEGLASTSVALMKSAGALPPLESGQHPVSGIAD